MQFGIDARHLQTSVRQSVRQRHTDRRVNDVPDEDIERLYNVILRGLERRRARLGGGSPKAATPIAEDATETLDLSN